MRKLYNKTYVETQLEKFRNRDNNHFLNHIRLVRDLISQYGPKPGAKVLDLGCSIGTFALELALDGYETIGLDFDSRALQEAKKLAQELGCNPKWICADAGAFSLEKKVDMVICFDLLEHLNDNTIIKMLNCIKGNLKKKGVLIFHTFPTEYDHVFYKWNLACAILIPFKSLPPKIFEKIVAGYSLFLNVVYLLRYAKTHKKYISATVHPNPLSEQKLKCFLADSGFEIVFWGRALDSINPLRPGQGVLAKKYFSKQPIACRSLFGVAHGL